MARLSSFTGRRIRLLSFVAFIFVLVILYVAAAPRMTRQSPFYKKTQEAISKARYDNDVANAMANAGDPNAKNYPGKVQDKSPSSQDRINDARAQREAGNPDLSDTLKERLRLAELAAKKSADEKWKGVKDAAEKASKEASQQADKDKQAAKDPGTQPELGANAKRNVEDVIAPPMANAGDTISQRSPAEVVASQIIAGVRESAKKEAIREALNGDQPSELLEHTSSSNAAAASTDTETAELLREMEAARTKQKERLKAEYKKQLKAQEMKRQQQQGAIAIDAEWREPGKLGSGSVAGKAPENRKSTGTRNPNPNPKPAEQKPLIPVPQPTTPAELEFQKLLALSPIVIFSKSYCPYSRTAKRILTQAFNITPSPYIVELDHHTYGPEIQSFLRARTGRGTVPNVIVAGKSIGGADEIEDYWEKNQLKAVIKEIAGKRIVGVVENHDIHKTGWKDY